MRKIAQFIINQRFIITPLLLLITVYTFTLTDDVNINYDFSKYLPEESIATQDTETIRDAIDFPISITLMIDDLEKDNIDLVKSKIEQIDSVEVVIIDQDDPNNYKEGHALYTIFLKSTTEDVGSEIENIEQVLNGYSFHLSGNYANTYHQELKVEEETPIILIVACVVIFVVLLVTTRRYLEPLAFGFVIGVAVVINLGTNVIFPEISYITKSVAAVLQLGLSMDYSIILLNNYYHELKSEKNNKQAMINALSNSLKPISASSLTTIIGLVALLFMSFTIGKDIGLVLSKGIVISLLCVFILLPNIILWLEKVPFNKLHKTLNLSNLSIKSSNSKITVSITAFAFLLIIAMFYTQSKNTFIFTDNTKFEDEEAIKEVFGDSNTFVIGVENNENLYNNEKIIIDTINENYQDKIISYLGEENSTLKKVSYKDIETISDEESAKLLLSVYALDHNQEHNMTYYEYIGILETLLSNNTIEQTDELNELTKVVLLKEMLSNSYTALELSATGLFTDTISENMVTLVYDMYEFDNNEDLFKTFTVRDFLRGFITLSEENEGTIREEEAEQLQGLLTSLDQINELLNTNANQSTFKAIALNNLGVVLDDQTVAAIYQNYFLLNNLEVSETIRVEDVLLFMSNQNMLNDQQKQTVSGLVLANQTANEKVSYSDVNAKMNETIYYLSGSESNIIIDNTITKITYISIMKSNNLLQTKQVAFIDILTYINILQQDPVFSSKLTEDSIQSLNLVNEQVSLLQNKNEYNKLEVFDLLSSTPNDDLEKLNTLIFATSLKDTNFLDTYEVTITDLLEYILNNDLGLEEETITEVTNLNNELEIVKKIITSDEMSLIVFNTTFPYESNQTKEFIDYIYEDVFDKVEEDTYFIGYSVSDQEIKMYFEDDLMKINFITIGSVLLILIIAFQSIIIPVLLVFTIEGAIWTTLSISYFQGQDIFFFCYIVIGAIQLGATIDYAIILTTNYQKYRKEIEKGLALREALKVSIPSILTSGTILTIAGFAIAIVSSQESIVSVGSFLGRGTLISMVFVVTILPSMLFTFDSLIIKTQKKAAIKKAKLKKQFNIL